MSLIDFKFLFLKKKISRLGRIFRVGWVTPTYIFFVLMPKPGLHVVSKWGQLELCIGILDHSTAHGQEVPRRNIQTQMDSTK